ncbi:MAG: type 4a pilus biogenesis protein PilO, partial [Solirubrobacterales bacterium]
MHELEPPVVPPPALMLFAVLSLLAVVQPTRPFNEERLLLDRRLETLRRILPDGPNPVADVALVREMAEGAKLGRVALVARPPVESGARGDVPIDVAAFGRFADIDRFFRQVTLSARLIDVESLTLAATNEDVIKLSAVVRLPYRPAKAPLPTPPEGKSRPTGVPRPTLDAYYRDQALALAKSDMVAQLRRSRR